MRRDPKIRVAAFSSPRVRPHQRAAVNRSLTGTAEQETRTFVVRLWHEPSTPGGESAELRGEIRDVISGDVQYFRFMDGLMEAIRSLMENGSGGLS